MSIMADIAEGLGGSMTTSKSTLGGLALNFRFVAGRLNPYSSSAGELGDGPVAART